MWLHKLVIDDCFRPRTAGVFDNQTVRGRDCLVFRVQAQLVRKNKLLGPLFRRQPPISLETKITFRIAHLHFASPLFRPGIDASISTTIEKAGD